MNRTMGAALVVLAVIGAAVAMWSPTATPRREAVKVKLSQVAAARDVAEASLVTARGEIDRLTAAVASAKTDAGRQMETLRRDAEAALVSARTEANKAVAAARVEGERQLAAAQADTNRAIAALKRETEALVAAAKAEAEKASGGGRLAAVREEAERALAAARAEAGKAVDALRDQLGKCQSSSKPASESARCGPSGAAPDSGPVAAEAIARELAASGSIALYGIEFDSGSARLTAESRSSIEEVVKLLKGQARLNLLIVGHTDSQGDFSLNREISEKRAQAVVTELVRQGIDAKRLSSAGVADLAPVSTNDTDEGRARNRRVELVKR